MAHVNLTLFDLPKTNEEVNKIDPMDLPIHDWYRFVLSFPPHLVREYIKKFGLNDQSLVLDPFCGTGTTIVECKKNGIPTIGIEALPMPYFASMLCHRMAKRLQAMGQPNYTSGFELALHENVLELPLMWRKP